MKTSQKKSLLIIGIIFLTSLLNFFVPSIFDDLRYLILLGAMICLVWYLLGINFKRNTNDKKITRNILIYIIAYYVIIYFAGFFIGFARNIYNYTISNLTLNILPSILTIVAVEIIRGELINKTNKNKLVIIFSIITFTIFEISMNFTAYNLYIQSSLYQFIGLLVMTSISSNILMTIIHTKTDKYPAMIYRFFMETSAFILLVEPDLGPYLKSVFLILLPILISMMLINMEKRVQDSPKNTIRSKKSYYIIIAILIIFVLINSGILKYQTLVIGSNSMYPYMERGDVVFIENTKDNNKLHKGDILVFRYDNKIVVHRITLKTKRNNKIYYKTKGDNNKKEDLAFLSSEQIKGKVLFRIKYIGLPTVWLSDLFK